MISENNNDQEEVNVFVIKKYDYGIMYTITHLIISMFAIYLSWKCNGGFNLGAFLIALFCPYLYILYVLAAKGGCGTF